MFAPDRTRWSVSAAPVDLGRSSRRLVGLLIALSCWGSGAGHTLGRRRGIEAAVLPICCRSWCSPAVLELRLLYVALGAPVPAQLVDCLGDCRGGIAIQGLTAHPGGDCYCSWLQVGLLDLPMCFFGRPGQASAAGQFFHFRGLWLPQSCLETSRFRPSSARRRSSDEAFFHPTFLYVVWNSVVLGPVFADSFPIWLSAASLARMGPQLPSDRPYSVGRFLDRWDYALSALPVLDSPSVKRPAAWPNYELGADLCRCVWPLWLMASTSLPDPGKRPPCGSGSLIHPVSLVVSGPVYRPAHPGAARPLRGG